MASNNDFYKEYKKVGEQDYKILGYYNVGGRDKRGYYLSVYKIKLEERDGYTIEKYTIDFGASRNSVDDLLLEVGRKSQKSEDKAFNMITEERINELINYLNN